METINTDCPTAVLVDISSTSCLKQNLALDNIQLDYIQEKLNGCKSVVQDLKDKVYSSIDVNSCKGEDSIDHSPKLNEENDQLSTVRLRWKTPSPKSMSRISKEASKVLHNLNSSEIFDEDSLLTDEIFPLPINFNIIDLEDNIEQEGNSQTENNCKNEILKSEVSVQTENVVVNATIFDDQGHDSESENVTACKIFQDNPIKSPLEASISDSCLKSSKESESNSKELFSSEIYSDSLNNSAFSITDDGKDDVFIVKQISSEDKENIQRRKHIILPENKIKSPLMSFKPKTKLEFRGTLKNLSNITHEIPKNSTKCSSSNANKNMVTPSRKMSLAKVLQPSNTKQQNTKELITSIQKPSSTTKNVSSNLLCKSSSSDAKQLASFTKIKTPFKRYSIATPKCASAMKPPMTPLHSFRNPPISRYTPQSVGNARFSFSKSWQQPTSNFSNLKNMKTQNHTSITGSTSASKMSSGRLDSHIQRRESFSQSMSAVSFQSLRKDALSMSKKNKFSSRLNMPSPLPVAQDRKLARVLFPSVSKK